MSHTRSKRRLAAILAADVVGYSALMGVDETQTHQAVKRLRTDLVEPLLRTFNGRLIKTTGDGFLFEFGSVFDAFDFGASVQGQGRVEPSLTLRMGLNVGDIIMDGDDVFGNGVNIAARLEPRSPPGGMMISNRAWEDLRKLPVDFTDAGQLELKNIRDPLQAWSLSAAQLRDYAASLEDGEGDSAPPGDTLTAAPAPASVSPPSRSSRKLPWLALVGLVGLGGAWLAWRPQAAASPAMEVRLGNFQILSAALPGMLSDTIRNEMVAAFNKDGVVGVSTAASAPKGTAPAYSLGGTLQREEGNVRVITHLKNDRSGTTLWSSSRDYPANEVDRVPRRIAVDAGNVVRCGLFGASTYDKPLPDKVMRDYLQFCEGHWDPDMSEGRKALVPAQRVVAALPDFSWGWAAVAGAYWKVAANAASEKLAEEARAAGRQAADRAVAIDPRNSEALYIKAMLVPRTDWLAREDLLKRATSARRLDCGCEHHQYGWMLANVGRTAEALEELYQAEDMLALYVYTPFTLAEVLTAAGKLDEARPVYDATIDLAPSSDFANYLVETKALQLRDAALLARADLPIAAPLRAALLQGWKAAAGTDPGPRSAATRALLLLPREQQNSAVAMLLADLGETHQALLIAARLAADTGAGPALFWYPSMRQTLSDPAFLPIATRLGLVHYWRQSGTRPDVCQETDRPPFCAQI